MCDRIGAGQWCVKAFLENPDGSFREIGVTYEWDKNVASRTYRKQDKKDGVRAVLYDPTGKRVKG